jgi:hypothetical protein
MQRMGPAADLMAIPEAWFCLFAGNYAVFEKTAAERLRNLRSRIESQEAHRKHVQVRFQPLRLATQHS